MNKILFGLFIIGLSLATLHGQSERWIYAYNGPANNVDCGNAICRGTDGAVYATGYSRGNDGCYDFVILKVDTAGAAQWTYRYGENNGRDDYGYAIIFGQDGNLYACGITRAVGFYNQFSVISLTPGGQERWIYKKGGTAGDDMAWRLIMGADLNVYAVGVISAISGFSVVSLDTAGAENWIHGFNPPGYSGSMGYKVVCGNDGNVYAAGKVYRPSTNDDIAVISIDPADPDTVRWSYIFDSSGNGDYAFDMLYGSDSNLYVCASTYNGSPTGHDIRIFSLETGGALRWALPYTTGQLSGADYGHVMIEGPGDNLFIGGCLAITFSPEWAILKVTKTGVLDTFYTYHGNSADGYAMALLSGPDNNLYAAGYACGTSNTQDWCIMSLDTNLVQRWVYFHDGPAGWSDWATGLVLGNDNRLYASGAHDQASTSRDFVVVSLETDIGIEEARVFDTAPIAHAATFFHRTIRIRLADEFRSALLLRLYDVTGRCLLVREFPNPDRIITLAGKEIAGLGSGTYFIDIAGGGDRATCRVIKVAGGD